MSAASSVAAAPGTGIAGYGYYDASTGQYWVVGSDGQAHPANAREVRLIQMGGGTYQVNPQQQPQYQGNGAAGYYDESTGQYYINDPVEGLRQATGPEAVAIAQNGGTYNFAPSKKNRYGIVYRSGADGVYRDPSGKVWDEAYDNAPTLQAQPDQKALAEQLAPGSTQPRSLDPVGGGPTYTPGINFGTGVIPGQGGGQRQWFDVGPNAETETLNTAYYNDPGNWDDAWAKVMNYLGGTPGGAFNDWLQSFSSQARTDYQNSVPYAPDLNVADFLDKYAPQLKGVYDLMPSQSKFGGGRSGYANRALY